MAALKRGWIEEFKAQLISDAVVVLSDEHALAVEARVLDKAAQQTPAQLRYALGKAVIAVDPEGAERRVESRPTEDGQATLTIHHSADRIAALHGIITGRAGQLKAMGGETRTLAQLEADVACDLFLGNRKVEVHLTMPASTALGVDDQPADVDGLPITAQAPANSPPRRPVGGGSVLIRKPAKYLTSLTLDTHHRRRWPHLSKYATALAPWPVGPTCDDNCECLCRRYNTTAPNMRRLDRHHDQTRMVSVDHLS
jgi:hypothetical protein